MKSLVTRVLEGDKRAAAKLISMIEDDEPGARDALRKLYRHTGKAHVVGFTGPPGAGKSSLISRLIKEFRKRAKRVGVIAVDPTSPFTGGAILGDRIRMPDASLDTNVFIRSMATRGHAGGLALATFDAVHVLEAFGADIILVETVGAGQSEVEIAKRAHTTVVVEMPASGDAVQILKAGILEIGDLYVVNKADLEGADVMVSNLELVIPERSKGWRPPVLRTVASEGKGISEVADQLESHWRHLQKSGELAAREKARAETELRGALAEAALQRLTAKPASERRLRSAIEAVVTRKLDVRTAAEELLRGGVPSRGR
ncbi:MAG TPA: methylmalonyl Co-A mutase-associated GTPase MeaB [Thermoplasmata archaeon]|jgi:LAO/AO transport system kinase|nr:methylmalonyl Co-A mutase-associated GTPase MeaB [Thermoplasmata archaeon]